MPKFQVLVLLVLLSFPAKANYYSVGEHINFTKQDEICLANNLYFEARGTDLLTNIAISTVVLNRVKEGSWGNSICKVISFPNAFSWTSRKQKITDKKSWKEALNISKIVLEDNIRLDYLKITNSLYYHRL